MAVMEKEKKQGKIGVSSGLYIENKGKIKGNTQIFFFLTWKTGYVMVVPFDMEKTGIVVIIGVQ